VEPIKVRRATRADAKDVAELVVRLKRLNSEFDPLFGVAADVRKKAEKYVEDSLASKTTLLLATVMDGKVIGMARGEVRTRLFYAPSKEGYITEMYILPEYRRRELGQKLLDSASKELVRMGAEIIVADLPSRNEIGVHFYAKRGFRRLAESYARIPQ
jgi:ribosomal protein S18 acetylase RimI-like enzyme